MPLSYPRAGAASVAGLIGLATLAVSTRALAVGEEITDVRVLDNTRTEESTIRSVAGVSIGDTLDIDTLDVVRERLNTTGLFADVNVWWEPHGSGVRINISVKDKFPWAPLPTASYSANDKSIGVIFVHGNLFGRGKQMLLGARLATIDSGVTLVYRDPSLFGTWAYWQVAGLVQRQVIPEYQNSGTTPMGAPITLANPFEFRETRLFSYGIEPAFGIAWLRRVKTQIGWHLEKFSYFDVGSDDPNAPSPTEAPLTQATAPGRVGVGRASLTFDFRAREFAVMTGGALAGSLDYASPTFGSNFTYWRAGASWEHGIKFFHSHNLVYFVNATIGDNMPFWAENTGGGTNLRGYLAQQFRGDTQLAGKVEYHFPLFSIGSLDFRALGFYDVSAIWFRDIPTDMPTAPDGGGNAFYLRNTPDQRTFSSTLEPGFHFKQDVHSDIGGGLRFFLRSVAVPLVGFDAGYGLESGSWRFILVVGA